MTFRQGALVLVMAGLLGGCVAPAKKRPPTPTAAVARQRMRWCRPRSISV